MIISLKFRFFAVETDCSCDCQCGNKRFRIANQRWRKKRLKFKLLGLARERLLLGKNTTKVKCALLKI